MISPSDRNTLIHQTSAQSKHLDKLNTDDLKLIEQLAMNNLKGVTTQAAQSLLDRVSTLTSDSPSSHSVNKKLLARVSQALDKAVAGLLSPSSAASSVGISAAASRRSPIKPVITTVISPKERTNISPKERITFIQDLAGKEAHLGKLNENELKTVQNIIDNKLDKLTGKNLSDLLTKASPSNSPAASEKTPLLLKAPSSSLLSSVKAALDKAYTKSLSTHIPVKQSRETPSTPPLKNSNFLSSFFSAIAHLIYNILSALFGNASANRPISSLLQDLKNIYGANSPIPDDFDPQAPADFLPFITPLIINNSPPIDREPGNKSGLINLSNTCYLNSTLQLIASSGHFNQALDTPVENPLADNLRLQLRGIISKVREGTAPTLTDLQLFYLLLRLNEYAYSPAQQGDPDELFGFLNEKITRFPQFNLTESLTPQGGGDFVPGAPLPMTSLSLPFSRTTPDIALNLQDLLNASFQPTDVEYRNERTQNNEIRQQKASLTGDLPPVMTFNLKRLFTDRTGSTRYAGIINVMQDIVINGVRYRPKSFTLHTGSARGGHYRDLSVQADGRLVLANDSAPIQPVAPGTAAYAALIADANLNATLCMYEKVPAIPAAPQPLIPGQGGG